MINKQEHQQVRELERLSVSQSDIVYTEYSELDIMADICCKTFGVDHDRFFSKSRERELADCRHMFFFMARNYTNINYTLKSIGQFTGGRDHTTVLHGVNTIYDRMDFESSLPLIASSILDEFNRLRKWSV